MAAEDVNAILQGLQIGQAQRAEAIRAGLEQQRVSNQKEETAARLELDKKTHEQTTQYQNAILKATQALHQVQRMKDLQDIGANIEKGQPAPGGVQVGQDATAGTRTFQFPGMTNEQGTAPGIIGNVPLPQELTVRTLGQVTKDQVAAEKPKLDLQAAMQAEIDKRQAHLLSLRDAEQEKRDKRTADRAAAHDIVLEKIAAGHDVARAKGETTSELPGDTLANYLKQADDGAATLTEFKKMIPLKEQGAFFNAASKAGVGFIDDKQKLLLGTFRPAMAAIDKAAELNSILEKNRLAGLAIGTQDFQRSHQLQKEINESLIQTAQAMGQQRLSDSRVKAMISAYDQSLNPIMGSVENNKKTAADLKSYILDTFHDKFANLPKRQQDKFLDTLQSPARGATSNKVTIIRDGVKGTVSPQFVKPTDQVVQE